MKRSLAAMILLPALLALASLDALAERDPFPWLQRRPAREPVFPDLAVSVSWLQSAAGQDDLAIVDVRPDSAYAKGHLPGALRIAQDQRFLATIRAGDPEAMGLLLGEAGLSGTETLVLYGDDHSYGALGRLFWALEWAGCAQLRVLDGGITAWTRKGGTLDRRASAREPRAFAGSARDSLRVERRQVLDRYGRDGWELLDLRGKGPWEASVDRDGLPGGHIPHSLPYDCRDLLPGDGRLPDPEEAWQLFGQLGPRPRELVDLDAVFLCYGVDGADERPGLAYLLLRLMDIRAAVYPGGWADWSADPVAPRVRLIPTEELVQRLRAVNPELAEDRVPAPFMLLDLRGQGDFDRKHLPGAVPLPAHALTDSLATVAARHWPGADIASIPVIFYCYGPTCTRSRSGATRAAWQGYRQLLWYRDGLELWMKAGYPVFK